MIIATPCHAPHTTPPCSQLKEMKLQRKKMLIWKYQLNVAEVWQIFYHVFYIHLVKLIS